MTTVSSPAATARLLSRRQLLQAGLAGSFALTAAGWFARTLPVAAQQAQPAFETLSPEGVAVLRAVIPAVLDGLLPEDADARAQAVNTSLRTIDRYMSQLPLRVQQEAHDAFSLVHFPPARIVLGGLWRSWTTATTVDITACLRRWRDSRFTLLRSLFVFLQSISTIGWFDQPQAWEAMGYDGP